MLEIIESFVGALVSIVVFTTVSKHFAKERKKSGRNTVSKMKLRMSEGTYQIGLMGGIIGILVFFIVGKTEIYMRE